MMVLSAIGQRSGAFHYFPDMPTIRQQLIRDMTSIATNYLASRCARSRKEWLAKLYITLEEIHESLSGLITCYGLDYINDAATLNLKKG